MTKVVEITYYVALENRKDWSLEEKVGQTMKRLCGVIDYSYGTAFVGDYAGQEYMALTFASYGDYAKLQDTWMDNQEWVAFLGTMASEVTDVVARQLLNVHSA